MVELDRYIKDFIYFVVDFFRTVCCFCLHAFAYAVCVLYLRVRNHVKYGR